MSVNHHIELTEEEKAQTRQKPSTNISKEQMNKMRNRDTTKRTSQRTDNRSTPTIIIRHVTKTKNRNIKASRNLKQGLRPIKGVTNAMGIP